MRRYDRQTEDDKQTEDDNGSTSCDQMLLKWELAVFLNFMIQR